VGHHPDFPVVVIDSRRAAPFLRAMHAVTHRKDARRRRATVAKVIARTFRESKVFTA
jgi:hypothetical protein